MKIYMIIYELLAGNRVGICDNNGEAASNQTINIKEIYYDENILEKYLQTNSYEHIHSSHPQRVYKERINFIINLNFYVFIFIPK